MREDEKRGGECGCEQDSKLAEIACALFISIYFADRLRQNRLIPLQQQIYFDTLFALGRR